MEGKKMRTFKLYLTALLLLMFYTSYAQEQRGVKVVVKDTNGDVVSSYKDSYALVVGVGDYRAGWPDLPNAVQDAKKVTAILEEHGFEVMLVENPTKQELQKAIENFMFQNGLFPDNRLVFYFAGHGHTMKMAYGGKLGYIVPSDAPLPYQDKSRFMRYAISMQDFENQSRQIQSKHVLYIFDSCFSGSIFALSRSIPEDITEKLNNPVRQFITAGNENEEVPDKSVFTQQLVEALKGDGDLTKDGYVTGSELGLFLQDRVEKYSKSTQHPQYGKIRDPNLDKGDFVFVLNKATPRLSTITVDNIKPSITDITIGTAKEGESFSIRANVTDDASGVEKVRLAYKSGSFDWRTVDMHYRSSDTYEYTILKEQIKNPELFYYFGATDKAGNKNTLLGPEGKGIRTAVLKQKSSKKWLWIIPPVAILAGYLIYQQMPGTVDIVVDTQ